jgi:ubiquinone/menaquinone biosynthesis C-methylase UbiE
MTDELLADLDVHYAAGRERERLADGRGALERERTQLLVARQMPPAPAIVLDVGGGAGVYARWLADLGYAVTLLDRYPLHVAQARAEGGFAVVQADARALPVPAGSADVVLLLGPLYHLTSRDDRLAALREARRVLRPGGVLAAAAISRHASLLDGVFRRLLEQPGFAAVVDGALATGLHDPPVGSDWFTRAYFHLPSELRDEVSVAGFADVDVVGVEGPGHWCQDLAERHRDPVAWEQVLGAAARAERDPATLAMSSHLLALARA